jgi:Ca2+/H+ antiporter
MLAVAFLALLPVAKLLGLVMEDVSKRVGATAGTFVRVIAGNMVELISGVRARTIINDFQPY